MKFISLCTSFVNEFSWRTRHSYRNRRITAEMIFGRGSWKTTLERNVQIRVSQSHLHVSTEKLGSDERSEYRDKASMTNVS